MVSPETVVSLCPPCQAPRIQHPLLGSTLPPSPHCQYSPIREQVELAGIGDAFNGVDGLLHDEHFHLLAAHLDLLETQILLAAAKIEGGREM